MRKIGPRRIVYTEYSCSPCRYLKEKSEEGKFLCNWKSSYLCNHPKLTRTFRSINLNYSTPDWCPVLNAKS